MSTFKIGNKLDLQTLFLITNRHISITIDNDKFRKLEKDYKKANDISKTQKVYGRSTGVGANKNTNVPRSEREQHAINLIRSHAVDSGDYIPSVEVRAALIIRLNQLLKSKSGISPAVVDSLYSLIIHNEIPEVREYGSIGTGDLSSLAGIGLHILGERSISDAKSFGTIEPYSALPFISSSAVSLSRMAFLLKRLESLMHVQRAAFLLSSAAFLANTEAFSADISEIFPNESALHIANTLENLLQGYTWESNKIQDPYAFRAFLPAHSTIFTSTDRVKKVIVDLINTGQENPFYDEDNQKFLHHGAFYQVSLAHELDSLLISVAQNVPLLLSRIRFLNDDKHTGLPRFLAPGEGGKSGTMIIEYVAADAMSEIVASSTPSSTNTLAISCGVEDDATFLPLSIRQFKRSLDCYEIMLAAEMLIASRAFKLRNLPTSGLSKPLLQILSYSSDDFSDRDLRNELDVFQNSIYKIA